MGQYTVQITVSNLSEETARDFEADTLSDMDYALREASGWEKATYEVKLVEENIQK